MPLSTDITSELAHLLELWPVAVQDMEMLWTEKRRFLHTEAALQLIPRQSAFVLCVFHLEGLVLFVASVLQRRAWLQFSTQAKNYSKADVKQYCIPFCPFHEGSPETRPS